MDEVLARIALERGFITERQLDECRRAQFSLPGDSEMTIGRAQIKPLGSVLVERSLINPDQLTELVAEQSRRFKALETYERMVQSEMGFGQLLVKRNKATQNQINKCLEIQRAMAEKGADPVPPLGRLLVEHGFVDAGTLADLQKLYEKSVLVCTNCGQQFNVVGVESGKTYKCKSCGGIMVTREMLRSLKPGDAAFRYTPPAGEARL